MKAEVIASIPVLRTGIAQGVLLSRIDRVRLTDVGGVAIEVVLGYWRDYPSMTIHHIEDRTVRDQA